MDDHDQGLTTSDIAGSSSSVSGTDSGDEPRWAGSGENGGNDQMSAQAAAPSNGADADLPLLEHAESKKFTDDWRAVQGEFVDSPREAVEQADRLVADLMQRLASQFSETRANLERQWDGHDDISTEELRVAMTRYRSFFERLLSA